MGHQKCFTIKGVGGGPQLYFMENCFIVFLDIGGHGGLKTFYGIEKYCSNPKISQFQNRDYHRLTLRKIAISQIFSKSSNSNSKTVETPRKEYTTHIQTPESPQNNT